MKKSDLIDKVSGKVDLTKKDVELVVDTFLEEIINTLAAGEKVVVSGFGAFEVRNRVARKGVDPRTGEEISIAAQKTPAFTAGKNMKEAVKK